MAENADTNSQRLLDARMEYEILMSTYLSLADMFWVGYRAFFTINTLLATGLGFTYSSVADGLDEQFRQIAQGLLPVTGIFISVIAIWTAMEIAKSQRLVINRGRELENLLFARIFTGFQPYAKTFPTGTTVGSVLFLLMWACAFFAAIK